MISHTNTVPLDDFTIEINIDVLRYIAIKIENILLYKMIIFNIRFRDDKGESHNYRINQHH